MYAIIATGGKQYKVSEGDVIKVEKLDAKVGESFTFDQVLIVNNGEVKLVILLLPVLQLKLQLYLKEEARR